MQVVYGSNMILRAAAKHMNSFLNSSKHINSFLNSFRSCLSLQLCSVVFAASALSLSLGAVLVQQSTSVVPVPSVFQLPYFLLFLLIDSLSCYLFREGLCSLGYITLP